MKDITDMEIRAALRRIIQDRGSVQAADAFVRSGEYPVALKDRILKLLHDQEDAREAAMAVNGDVDDINWE